MTAVTADMHCVTRWSRFDVRWEGVAFSEVMKLIALKPAAKYVMVLAEQGYTSNVPLADLLRPTTLFALKHNGEPLPAEHGYPVRLVVPHLYAWKSVKWVRGLEFMDHDAPGFWEAKRLQHVRRSVSRSSATVSKRIVTRASGVSKSQQAKLSYRLASELRESKNPAERQRAEEGTSPDSRSVTELARDETTADSRFQIGPTVGMMLS